MAKWYQKIFNWKGDSKAYSGQMQAIPINSSARVVWIDDMAHKYVSEGYSANDIVYSIINQAAEKERMAPWNVYKVKEESSLKLYHAELGKKEVNYKKALDYRTKALELYTG